MAREGANIQLEEGNWSKVHNGIWEALAKAALTGGEFRCLMFLFRKTYGYNKKEDAISLAQWAEGTGMKRQNVWNVLQRLLGRHLIYRVSHGEKRPITWGFNKYSEQWGSEAVMLDEAKSVISDHNRNEQTVMPEHDSQNSFVMLWHDKSVIAPHEHTKDKKESSLLAVNEAEGAILLVREAYQVVCKIGPPLGDATGQANLIVACALIQHFTFATCMQGIATLRERNHVMIKKQGHGISAPLPYLRAILSSLSSLSSPHGWQSLEGELGPALSVPARVEFALEDILP